MSDLVEFLLARIAEDEAADGSSRVLPNGNDGWGELRFDPADGRVWSTLVYPNVDVTDEYHAWVQTLPLSKSALRVRAECEAKRRIVEETVPERDPYFGRPDYDPEWVIRLLAQPYATHPDFREEWRP